MRALAVLVLSLLAACVSSETYRKKEAEADQLASEMRAEELRRVEFQKRFDEVQRELDQMGADLTDLRTRIEAREAERTAESARMRQRSDAFERISTALKTQIDAGRVELSELRGRLTVRLGDRVLFPSASAALGRQGRSALAAVAGVLRRTEGRSVRVEGHTDDVRSKGGPYPSNWELSTARAVAVVRYLQAQGVDPARLGAAGYGPYRPVAPNVTASGRAQNRRIEIVLAPPDEGEPPPRPDPASAR